MDSNYIKHEVVADMEYHLKVFMDKLRILEALDKDTSSSGAYDLYDQLKTLRNGYETLVDCLNRAGKIIPYQEDN